MMSGFEIFQSFRQEVAHGVILSGVDTAVTAKLVKSIEDGEVATLSEVVRR